MIANLNQATTPIGKTAIISGGDGRYYVIQAIKRFGPTCRVTLEHFDPKTCSLTGSTIEVSGDCFQEGSGFGGLPYFRESFCNIRHRDGVFYCDLQDGE